MPITLKELRTAAGLSQEELGLRINLSQAQISRYESEPGSAPLDLVELWCGACGTSLEDASRAFTSVNHLGIDAGDPYAALRRQLELLEQYVGSAPEIPEKFPPLSITPTDFSVKLREWKRKPTVLIAGRFDSAKTRIANALLGSNNLPAQYTPTTSVVTFVRHLSDRPAWQREEVWIMGKNFNPTQWDEEKHCESHKVMAGSFDTLRKFGTKDSEGEAIGARSALVYMDAPILRSCTLIDLPGYADEYVEEQIANASSGLADILIYTSPAKGFLDASDFLHLGMLLRSLSAVNKYRNLFIVATHADPSISEEDLKKILKKGRTRLYKHLKDSIFREHHLGEEELRSRFFTFWYENQQRREALESDLHALLATDLPPLLRDKIDAELKAIKSQSKGYFSDQIQAYQRTLAQIEAARQTFKELRAELPSHRKRVAQMREKFKVEVESCRNNSIAFVGKELTSLVEPAAIEEFIRKNFHHKDEAKKDAIAKLLEDSQSQLESFLKTESDKLKPIIEDYLKQYDVSLSKVDVTEFGKFESVPFDAHGAFLGGLAGIGTLGALGLWASTVGNLGGYILVAKLASVLSALGLGVGSTAAVSFVAALGGPITLAVGLASLFALGIWALFGESWQSRLSKKISKILRDKKFIEKTEQGTNTFWDQTLTSFETGANETERKFDDYLSANEALVSEDGENSRLKIERTLGVLEGLKDFFGGIPWRWTG
ncbi:MAG: helix-turn-helix domain-containing protein [Terriglobales bacterium]